MGHAGKVREADAYLSSSLEIEGEAPAKWNVLEELKD
jgi:hypothetical protein